MYKPFLALLALIAVAFGQCTWPNGTDTTFHWWQDPSNVFTTYSIYTADANGKQFLNSPPFIL